MSAPQSLPPGEPLKSTWKIAPLIPLIRPGENGARALKAMGKKANSFNIIRLAWGAPSPTIVKFAGAWRVALIRPDRDELATARELCRLQSFPDEFQWGDSTYGQIHDRLGNSVPPLLMRAIAMTVRDTLSGDRPQPAARSTHGYGAELSSAWADHLAPRKPDASTVVSLFAGCGGSSLGYSMAGYRELLAVEWDAHAADVFRLNFPDVPLHHGDVNALDPAVLGLAPGELDVLDGSPPCQGFSTSGSRKMDDPRNDLFRQYVRLLDAWQPRAFVMENVSGLVKGKMKLKFAEMLAALKSAGPGYTVTVRLLDASRFRVPQSRQRLIFLGLRNDLGGTLDHPLPMPGRLTVRDAWADLASPGLIAEPGGKIGYIASLMQPGENGSAVLKRAGRKATFWDTWRLRWAHPANTIPKSAGHLFHPTENRLVGAAEAARLQSFPDEYLWGAGGYSKIMARIGNSVPPLMMRAISTAVRDSLHHHPREAL